MNRIVSICLVWLSIVSATAATLNVPASYATVQLAMAAANPGDTVLLAAGYYNEQVDTVRNGTIGSPITIDGQGVAILRQIDLSHEYHTIKNITISGNAAAFDSKVYVKRNAHYTILEDVIVDGEEVLDTRGIYWQNAATPPFGTGDVASNCTLRRVTLQNIRGTPFLSIEGDDWVVEDCIFQDGEDADFIQMWGRRGTIRNSIFRRMYDGADTNHIDWVQTFGNNGFGSKDHVIEGNFIYDCPGMAFAQLEGNLVTETKDWTFLNNVCTGIGSGMSISIPGMKFYGNTFYQVSSVANSIPINAVVRWYESASIHSSVADRSLMTVHTASGDMVANGRYIPYMPQKASGEIEDGVLYEAVLGSGESITYNGVTYTTSGIPSTSSPLGTFTGVSGVTTFSTVGTVQVYVRGYITYGGVNYYRERAFSTGADVTYTASHAGITVYRMLANYAHNTILKGNVFLDCGGTSLTWGWYAIDTLLTGCEADYNYVGKNSYGAVTQDSLAREIGDAGGWDWQKWYEPNGINGGDPGFLDETTGDFQIASDSILIGQGVTLAALTDDYAGVTRPSPPAMGAYEYGTPATDTTAPELTSVSVSGSTVTLDFSETVTGMSAANWTFSTGSLSALSGSGSSYTMTISPAATFGGAYTISYAPGSTVDAATNALASITGRSVLNSTVDPTTPSVRNPGRRSRGGRPLSK